MSDWCSHLISLRVQTVLWVVWCYVSYTCECMTTQSEHLDQVLSTSVYLCDPLGALVATDVTFYKIDVVSLIRVIIFVH